MPRAGAFAVLAAAVLVGSARAALPLPSRAAWGSGEALYGGQGGTPTVAREVFETLARHGAAEVIVSLKPGPAWAARPADIASARREVAAQQADLLRSFPPGSFTLRRRFLSVPAFSGVAAAPAIEALTTNANVEAVSVDSTVWPALAQSAKIIHAPEAQAGGYTGKGVVAAVLDTGIDTDHPDLADSVVVQECRLEAGGCPPAGGTTASGPGSAEDDGGHGTMVAGIITSNGVVAPKGIAPEASIAAYKVMGTDGAGHVADWLAGLDDIVVNHPEIRLVNMSLTDNVAHPGGCDSFVPAATSAIGLLRDRGVLTFIAAGNNGFKDALTFPACITGAVAVGATYDYDGYSGCQLPAAVDGVTCWSNSDSGLDLLGPGAMITTDWPGGITSTYAGTSFATPHAVGVAAMLVQQDPARSADQIETLLEGSGVRLTDPLNGRVTPRVDASVVTPDTDGDGVHDLIDNCVSVANPDQANTDAAPIPVGRGPSVHGRGDETVPNGDGLGDACDPDIDNDGLPNASEGVFPIPGCPSATGPTDPLKMDTDGDGVTDGGECAVGSDPANPSSRPVAEPACTDSDGDGVRDALELRWGTDPNKMDTNGDGLPDGVEIMDVSGDGFATLADALTVGRAYPGIPPFSPPPLTEAERHAYDTNRDGAVNLSDAVAIVKFYNGYPAC